MTAYIIRRLLLLPVTLFAIILVNFVILNLAPGDPASLGSLSPTGEATRKTDESGATGENQYLLFREHYGLTLPILLNPWPLIKKDELRTGLNKILSSQALMSVQQFYKLKTLWGDRARFIMPLLLAEATDLNNTLPMRRLAANFFIRGGTVQGHVGATLSKEQRQHNRRISENNMHLASLRIKEEESIDSVNKKVTQLNEWYHKMGGEPVFKKKRSDQLKTFFFETRFCRYLARVATLNFGTLRNDSNKSVISEVTKRIKYSLTLAVIPLLFTFILCQFFGMVMAVWQNRWLDYSLNIFFLILFAIPVFVVAPFLIEKFALNKTVPFTKIPIPYSGFHSPAEIYDNYTSYQRMGDILLHLFLPLIAIKYGTLAVQARLARTAFLEVLRQDYVRTARAKGMHTLAILVKHVGRNGSITIVTSLAASLGVVLAGSLIVETLFEINGFGRFFYQAIVNRDYNVVLFSAFAGSFLTLIGYFLADIAYTFLDPRITLD